jgi:hypothetical protein
MWGNLSKVASAAKKAAMAVAEEAKATVQELKEVHQVRLLALEPCDPASRPCSNSSFLHCLLFRTSGLSEPRQQSSSRMAWRWNHERMTASPPARGTGHGPAMDRAMRTSSQWALLQLLIRICPSSSHGIRTA